MKFRLPNNLSHSPAMIVSRLGYLQIKDALSGKTSYVHKFTAQRYPRFHLYIKENTEEIIFDLHLDQAKPRYEGQTAHKADYETPEVKNELTRIYLAVEKFKL